MTPRPTVPVPFKLSDPLPRGLTILEASAGTGKTYTIEWLVVRYVAEEVPLPRLLVVTFTRAATAELRDRVRTRLVRAAELLERVLAGAPPPSDPLGELLTGGPEKAVRERLVRLRTALGDFDAATISTIHGFCQHVLGSLGLTGDADRGATLVEDERDLVESVVDDLLVRRFHNATDDLVLSRRDALAIAGKVVGNPDADVVPHPTSDETAAMRVRFAHRVRDEVDRRKRTAGLLSFNDVLTRLADTLTGGDAEARATARRLRQQYEVALIDEFQDTDPTQWRILDAAFGGGDRPLVLIGDPKQAIYSFRGADVYAYLQAARTAEPHTLATNWRSDQGLLVAYNTLFRDARLGHDEIRYRDVAAPPAHHEARIVGAPVEAPLQLRVVQRDGTLPTSARGYIQADAARDHIARDLAVQVVGLLASEATLIDRDADGRESRRRVTPPGLAVLVRRNADAALVQRHLRAAGVPAVINGVGSVFATDAAEDWLVLLRALERPSSPARARVAVLSTFLGWDAQRVATAPDRDWDDVHHWLHRWASLLRDRSVAALWQAVSASERLPARLLARSGGERTLTDLAHLAELLHAAARAEGLGVTAMTAWLREQIAQADEDTQPDERARRLETDAEAVQVMTVHRSKGLEFDVVYCPYLWAGGWVDKAVPVFHPADSSRRTVDVGGSSHPESDDHAKDAEREQREEDLRLLYVALTRARHQCVVWWAPGGGAWDSPLARMLFCRDGGGPVNSRGKPSLPDDAVTMERLDRLAQAAGGTIRVEAAPADPGGAVWAQRRRADEQLDAATLERTLDHAWRRHSYSAITRHHSHEAASETVGSEAGEPLKDDEDVGGGAPAGGEDTAAATIDAGSEAAGAELEARLRAVSSPLGAVGGGVAFGTFVHAVLEDADFAAGDLTEELSGHIAHHLAHRHLDVGGEGVLPAALTRMLATPLGPLFDNTPLRQVARGERLDELAFELPLVGGRDPTGGVGIADIAAVLGRRLAPGDALAEYPERLAGADTAGADLRGYLTGSIDAVIRLPGPRFAVVDYKTNWLGVHGEPLSAWHYRPAALTEAMMRAHYPLQALLYSVALHRYLRWRQTGYNPDTHLAGAAYLFVRGMSGADVPTVDGHPCGVFAWQAPPGLVEELSDLLDAGAAAAGRPRDGEART